MLLPWAMFRSPRSIAVSCFCSGGFLDPCFPLPRPAPASLFCKKPKKLNPLFSNPSALFKKEYFANSFPIKGFRTLLQNTGGTPSTAKIHLLRALATHCSLFATISLPFNTYKTDRKQTTLTSFGMNTYAKPRGGLTGLFSLGVAPHGGPQVAGDVLPEVSLSGRL